MKWKCKMFCLNFWTNSLLITFHSQLFNLQILILLLFLHFFIFFLICPYFCWFKIFGIPFINTKKSSLFLRNFLPNRLIFNSWNKKIKVLCLHFWNYLFLIIFSYSIILCASYCLTFCIVLQLLILFLFFSNIFLKDNKIVFSQPFNT